VSHYITNETMGIIPAEAASLPSPPTHWLEYDHLEVVQRLDSCLDREVILAYALPIGSIDDPLYKSCKQEAKWGWF
jgi:hypothetical protein